MLLELNNVSKKYKSNFALKEVTFGLEQGKVLGLLGPNGSGKTTMMKLIQGYLKPNKGTIKIDGKKPSAKTKAMVSYLPDTFFIPDYFTIDEAMETYEDFFKDFNREKAIDLLYFMNLKPEMKVSTLSKGMTEKLHLALILSRDAKLYILDEPISGVDLVTRDKILGAIVNNISEGSSMIISTHLVDEIEGVIDEVAFINEGQIILSGEADALREQKGKQIADIYRDLFKEEA